MLPSLAALKIEYGVAAIGVHHASDGINGNNINDAALADLSRPILKNRPGKYANDVARQIWGVTWHEVDKELKALRLKIAEEILVLMFPGRLQNDNLTRTIDERNISKFVAVVKAKLPRRATSVAPPPQKKYRKKRPSLVIPRDDTTDEEEYTPPPPPDRMTTPPPDRMTTLPPDLLKIIMTEVVFTEDPCSGLEDLCVLNKALALLCRKGQLYATVNANFGWAGTAEETAINIFKRNCKRRWAEFYALPTKLRRGYAIVSDFQKRLFLRYHAVSTFLSDAEDRFAEEASNDMYGPVNEGDYEKAGYTSDMSYEVRLGRVLLEPLEEQYDKIKRHWLSKGIDVSDDRLFFRDDEEFTGDLFENTYKDIVREYLSVAKLDKNSFNIVLDNFVTQLLVVPDSDEDDD